MQQKADRLPGRSMAMAAHRQTEVVQGLDAVWRQVLAAVGQMFQVPELEAAERQAARLIQAAGQGWQRRAGFAQHQPAQEGLEAAADRFRQPSPISENLWMVLVGVLELRPVPAVAVALAAVAVLVLVVLQVVLVDGAAVARLLERPEPVGTAALLLAEVILCQELAVMVGLEVAGVPAVTLEQSPAVLAQSFFTGRRVTNHEIRTHCCCSRRGCSH